MAHKPSGLPASETCLFQNGKMAEELLRKQLFQNSERGLKVGKKITKTNFIQNVTIISNTL